MERKRTSAIEQSRLSERIWRTAPLVIAGLLAISFALAPQPWRDALAAALGVTLAWLAGLGALDLALALGAALLLVATLFVLVPRRARPQATATVNGIAPVSVYLDIENGQVTAVEVRALMEMIRAVAKGRTTDLLFYGNAQPQTETYKQFWRHGFRPIDVPYKQLGKHTATNIADLGLALHAFERALFGPPGQIIVIISQDQGFLPLVYRLHALGHSIAIWARDVQDSYKDAAKYLADVTWTNLALASPQEPTARAPSRVSARPPAGPRPAGPAAHPTQHATAASTLATVKLAMEATISSVVSLAGKPNAAKRLRATLGEMREHILEQIGYNKFISASSRVECWLEHLGALGVLDGVAYNSIPAPGSTSPDAAVALYRQFLGEVVDVAEQVASADADGRSVRLSDVCARVAGAGWASPYAASALAPLLAEGEHRSEQHARYFCQCARALGLLSFTDTSDAYTIRLAPRTINGAASESSNTAPLAAGPTAPGDAGRAGKLPPA